MLEMKFTPIISALPSPSGFSALISSYPTSDVIVGEAIFLHVSGVVGFADVDADLDFEWELGEPGKTPIRAIALRSNDLNKVQGRSASMAWDTAGQKTVTLTIRDKAGNTHTETHTVTVKERDAVAWTKIYYIDFGEVSGTPDFTDAPAETSVVEHVSSFTALRAAVNSDTSFGARLLLLFKRGETFSRDNPERTGDTNRLTVRGRTFATSIAEWGTGADAELRVDVDGFAYDWFYLKGQNH